MGKRPVHLIKDGLAFNSLEDFRHHDDAAAVVLNLDDPAAMEVAVPGRIAIPTTVGRTDARNPVDLHVRDEWLPHVTTDGSASS